MLEINVRPNPDVIAHSMDGSLLLFHVKTDRFYETNGTGGRLWELLNTGSSTQEIYEQLLLEYAVDAQQLAQEITTILDTLIKEKLVTVQDE